MAARLVYLNNQKGGFGGFEEGVYIDTQNTEDKEIEEETCLKVSFSVEIPDDVTGMPTDRLLQ